MSLLAPIELTPRSKASLTNSSSSSRKKENIGATLTPGSNRSSPSRGARPVGYLLSSSPVSRLLSPQRKLRQQRSVEFSDLEFGTPLCRSSPKHRRYHPFRRPAPKVDPTDPNQLVRKPQFLLPTAYPTPQSRGTNGTPKSILKTTGAPINLAQTLFEGTKFNSGPRRHSLTLPNLANAMSAAAVQSALHGLTDLSQILESPLSTLKASLNQLQNASIFLPATAVAIVPRDVEHAYAVLTIRLQAWANFVESKATGSASQGMIDAAGIVAACLKRDLGNLVNAPSTSLEAAPLADPSSSPPPDTVAAAIKRGKSEEELNRKRVMIDVAQSAVKMAGIIVHFRTFYSAFQDADLQAILDLVLRIPHTESVRLPKDREIVAFSMWFLSAQELPAAVLRNSSSAITESIMAVLNSERARTSEKARRSHVEALSAIQNLTCQHPNVFTAFHETKQVLWIMKAFQHRALQTRLRSLSALGGMVLSLTHAWTDATTQVARSEARNKLIDNTFAFFTLSERCEFKDLENQLLIRKKKPEEMPWILGMLALLPVLLGHKFKRLEPQGPATWMQYMKLCATHPSESIRTMQYFVWNHLMYSWLQISKKSRDYSGPHAYVWALEDGAFEKIIQPIRTQGQVNKVVEHSEEWKRIQVLTGQLVVSILYGFTGYIHQHCMSTDGKTLDLTLGSRHFTKLWDKIVNIDLVSLASSRMSEVKTTAWKCFAALLDSQQSKGKYWSEERLLYVDLLSGHAFVPLAPNATKDLCADILESAIQPEEIVALPQKWIAENLTMLLSTFKRLLLQSMDHGRLLDNASPVVQSWSRICAAVAVVGEDKPAQVQELIQWLFDVCKESGANQPVASTDFRHRCFLMFCEAAANTLSAYTTYFRDTLQAAQTLIVQKRMQDILGEMRDAQKTVILQPEKLKCWTQMYSSSVPNDSQLEHSSLLSTSWAKFWSQYRFEKQLPEESVTLCVNYMCSCLNNEPQLGHLKPILESLSNLAQIDYRSILDRLCTSWLLASQTHSLPALSLLITSHSSRDCMPTDGLLKLCDIRTKNALPMRQFTQVFPMLTELCKATHQNLASRLSWLEALAPLLTPWLKLAELLCAEDQRDCAEFYAQTLALLRATLQGLQINSERLSQWQELILAGLQQPSGYPSFALLWNDIFAPSASELVLSDELRIVLFTCASSFPALEVKGISYEDSLDRTMTEAGHISESDQSQSLSVPCPDHAPANYSADVSMDASARPSPSFSAQRPELAELPVDQQSHTPDRLAKCANSVDSQKRSSKRLRSDVSSDAPESSTRPRTTAKSAQVTPPQSSQKTRRPRSQPSTRRTPRSTSVFECVEIPPLSKELRKEIQRGRQLSAKRKQLKRSYSEGDVSSHGPTSSTFSAILPVAGLGLDASFVTPVLRQPAGSTSSLTVPTSHKQDPSASPLDQNIKAALDLVDEPSRGLLRSLSIGKMATLLMAGLNGFMGAHDSQA